MKTQIRRIIAVALVTMLMGTPMAFAATVPTATPAAAPTVPSDVSGQPYEKAVAKLMEIGAITGDTNGLFNPETILTRAQAAAIIVKTINPIGLNGTATQKAIGSGFSDLTGYAWAKPYINYMTANGIALGYADGTFKPGNKVTFAELTTFVVRASGFMDKDLEGAWPNNYIAKAVELGAYKEMGITVSNGAITMEKEVADTTTNSGVAVKKSVELKADTAATKAMAAQMTYNKLDAIKSFAPVVKDEPQGTDKDNASSIPSMKNYTYASGSFNGEMTTFNGNPLASDVQVYTYGIKKDYSKGMTISAIASDYRMSTIAKYKSVTTPAWYNLQNGKIISIVLPMDVGFSGKIYCVINGTGTTVLNAQNQGVKGIETVTAMKDITWFAKKDLANIPGSNDYKDGIVYELYAQDGEIQQIAKVGETAVKGKRFVEITSAYTTVLERQDGLVKVKVNKADSWYGIKTNASIYVYDTTDNQYKAGNLSSIRKNSQVRLYDISDDDETSADIVVVK